MLNKVVLMGRLVAAPELKTTPSGTSVTSFRLAVDRNHGKEKQTDFFDCTAWRYTAEFVCKNFTKGDLIAVDGALQTREFMNKEGQKRTVTEVMVENVFFTGERRERLV
jgi:single-strand DNA-binding protein